MPNKQRRSYTLEFRQEAVKLVVEQGYTYPEAAERLCVPFHSLKKSWVKQSRAAGTAPSASRLLPDSRDGRAQTTS